MTPASVRRSVAPVHLHQQLLSRAQATRNGHAPVAAADRRGRLSPYSVLLLLAVLFGLLAPAVPAQDSKSQLRTVRGVVSEKSSGSGGSGKSASSEPEESAQHWPDIRVLPSAGFMSPPSMTETRQGSERVSETRSSATSRISSATSQPTNTRSLFSPSPQRPRKSLLTERFARE